MYTCISILAVLYKCLLSSGRKIASYQHHVSLVKCFYNSKMLQGFGEEIIMLFFNFNHLQVISKSKWI